MGFSVAVVSHLCPRPSPNFSECLYCRRSLRPCRVGCFASASPASANRLYHHRCSPTSLFGSTPVPRTVLNWPSTAAGRTHAEPDAVVNDAAVSSPAGRPPPVADCRRRLAHQSISSFNSSATPSLPSSSLPAAGTPKPNLFSPLPAAASSERI